MKLPDNVYNVLKWVCIIVLPALATFYFTLAQIWGLPYAEQICGTITAVDLLIGTLIGVSTVQYNKQIGGKK